MSQPKPDHARTLAFVTSYLLVSIVVLIVVPPENWIRRWPHLSQLLQSFSSAPVWDDGDRWTTNWVGHPIMGMLLFSFARHNGHSVWRSALVALVASTAWEFVIEGWFEQPSIPDLLTTPILGSALGEARWWFRSRLLALEVPSSFAKAALALVAPLESFRRWRRNRTAA